MYVFNKQKLFGYTIEITSNSTYPFVAIKSGGRVCGKGGGRPVDGDPRRSTGFPPRTAWPAKGGLVGGRGGSGGVRLCKKDGWFLSDCQTKMEPYPLSILILMFGPRPMRKDMSKLQAHTQQHITDLRWAVVCDVLFDDRRAMWWVIDVPEPGAEDWIARVSEINYLSEIKRLLCFSFW